MPYKRARKEVRQMAIVPKSIKAVLAYSQMPPEQFLGEGYAVVKGLTGNPNLTNPPVDLALLKSMLDAYAVTIGDTRDGGRKAITLRNKQGKISSVRCANLQPTLSSIATMIWIPSCPAASGRGP